MNAVTVSFDVPGLFIRSGLRAANLLMVAALLTGTACGSDDSLSAAGLREAVTRAIPPLEAGMRGSAEKRECFTCHNQAVPVFALLNAKKHGFDVNEENLQRQIQHTLAHLQRGRESYQMGKGQGGQIMTAGYALWTLEDGQHPADELTAAVTHYLLQHQQDQDHWVHRGSRPPSSGSDFTATYVTVRALSHFATQEQQAAWEIRRQNVSAWIQKQPPVDAEDHVFRLRLLKYLEVPDEFRSSAIADLKKLQREDGGWAQTTDRESDAYATATTVSALMEDGDLPPDDTAVARGLAWLLQHQQADGTWHVVTRAVPIQTYFESGFPHGRDQFISMAATAWATLAISQALPDSTPADSAADNVTPDNDAPQRR